MKKIQKGFSLVELMVVVAIVAILAAVAIPMYSNYTTRAKVSAAIAKVSGIKAEITEAIIGEGLSKKGIITLQKNLDIKNLPTGVKIANKTGVVTLSENDLPKGSTIILTPKIGDGIITWDCTGNKLSKSQLPASCKAK